jgi:hypothetical protein
MIEVQMRAYSHLAIGFERTWVDLFACVASLVDAFVVGNLFQTYFSAHSYGSVSNAYVSHSLRNSIERLTFLAIRIFATVKTSVFKLIHFCLLSLQNRA